MYPTSLGAPYTKVPKVGTNMSSQLAENGDIHCWYAEMQQWFESHGMSVNALSPSQYSLDCPHLNMTKVEKNRVIWTDIINLENKITSISPKISLNMKMAHYKTHILHTSEDGFIIRPPYMDIHLSYAVRSVIGQLRNFITSVTDWGRQIYTNTSRRKNLLFVSSRSGIWRTLCLSQ